MFFESIAVAFDADDVQKADPEWLQDHGLWGQLKSTTDPNGAIGERRYDAFGRVTMTVGPFDSVTYPSTLVSYHYAPTYSWLRTENRITSGQPETQAVEHYRDGLGRTLFTRSPSADPNQDVIAGEQDFNALGQVVRQYANRFIPSGTMPDAQRSPVYSELTYDAFGRAIQECQQPANFCSDQIYDLWAQESINANGHKQRQEFDAFGQLIRVIDYQGADGRAASFGYPAVAFQTYTTTEYTYDSEGALTQTIQDVGQDHIITSIQYDLLDRKIAMNDPGMGAWSYEYDVIKIRGQVLTCNLIRIMIACINVKAIKN